MKLQIARCSCRASGAEPDRGTQRRRGARAVTDARLPGAATRIGCLWSGSDVPPVRLR